MEIVMSEQSPLIHAELSEQIIGAAMTVSNELFPGLNERLYENSLIVELNSRGLHVEQQQIFSVQYKGHVIGKFRPDLIVESKIIVDAKVVEAFNETHFKQVYGYLAVTELQLGLLLNFKYAKLQWKRVIRNP
jgi:GxxExxY protein